MKTYATEGHRVSGVELPYHCEKLNIKTLRSPCAGNLAKIETLKEKAGASWGTHGISHYLGFLEKCLWCKGKDLIIREAPVSHLEEKQAQGPDLVNRPQVQDSLVKNQVEVPPGQKEDIDMAGVVVFKNAAEAERVLGPGKLPSVAPAPPVKGQFCKNHPKVEARKNKHGNYMGLCRECMVLRASRNYRNLGLEVTREKMTAAVARDLGKKKATPSPGDIAFLRPGETASPAAADTIPQALPRCATHNLPIKFNAKGISMGGCEECRRDIAALGWHRAKIQLAQDPLERVFGGHSEELTWLRKYAQTQVRTPEGQLVFLVRQSMASREGLPVE